MKKTKLLTPILGAAALVSVATPIIALTSCNKNKSEDLSNIVAVVFLPMNGQDPIVKTCTKGSTVMLPTAPQQKNYFFSGWYVDSDCTIEFDPTAIVEKNMVVYAGWYSSVGFPSLPRTTMLPYYDSDDGFTSSKTFTIYNTSGVARTDITYYSDNSSVATVDAKSGEISLSYKGEGEYANIFAYDSKSTLVASTRVYPVKANKNVEIQKDEDNTNFVSFNEFIVDVDGNCVLPDTIIATRGGKEIECKLAITDPTDDANIAAMKAAHNLYLPIEAYSIEGKLFNTSGAHLQNIYFNDKVESFKTIYATSENWMGPQVISVQCSDDEYALTNRKEASLQTENAQIVFKTDSFTKGSTTTTDVVVRFDYSNIGLDLLSANHNIIQANGLIYKQDEAYPVVWKDVYLDGEKLSQVSDYDIIREVGKAPAIAIGGTSGKILSSSSNLVISATISFKDEESVDFRCQSNLPKENLYIKLAPRKGFKVGNIFSIGGLVVEAELADGTKVEIPNNLLKFTDKSGKELIPGQTVLSAGNAGLVTITWANETLGFTSTANYTITVSEK